MRIPRRLGAALTGATIATMALAGIVMAATIVVTPTNQQGWSTADTRPGGTVEFVADANAPGGSGALELTTDATTSAKAQYLHEANTPLADVTELGYWTRQVSGPPHADPAYQLIMCLNGTAEGCEGFTTLVFEPYQGGLQLIVPEVWQEWDVDAGRFWSTRTVTCDGGTIVGASGGPAIYTLEVVQEACPDAVVAGFGVNIGTFNPGYVVRTDLFDFNGTIYDFELTAEPEDADDCKDGGWQFLTDADGEPFRNQGDCIKYVKTGK